MTPSVDVMVNSREAGKVSGNLPMRFWSGRDWMKLILPDVAHVPLLADRGHKHVGKKREGFLCLSGFRLPLDLIGFSVASIVPVDINTFHASHERVYEKLLCSTANQLKVVLVGTL